MPPKLDEPIPLEALRDLIGICRALYAAWCASGVGPVELEDLLQVGKDLVEAHRIAKSTPPGTIGHRAAWSRAEEAMKRLGHLVTSLESLHPVLTAATKRVVGAPDPVPRPLSERDQKKLHRH